MPRDDPRDHPGARCPAHAGATNLMDMDVITTHGLTKTYGPTTVVDSLDLAVPAGSVYGFLGPNGSGKSTTMKMLLRLVRPTRGDIEIFGRPMNDANRRELLAHIGSLIEAPSVYGHLTGAENMAVTARLLRLDDAAVRDALATVRLTEHKDKLVRHYSLGMRQRLGIALALAREPRLLILDEPTNGLDPAGTEEIRQLLGGLAERGVTVMVSSHQLAEIDKMAGVIGILDHGRLVFQGTRAQLFEASRPDILIETPEPDRAADLMNVAPGGPTTGEIRLGGLSTTQTAEAVARLVRHDVPIHAVRREEQTLEDVFLALTGRGGQL